MTPGFRKALGFTIVGLTLSLNAADWPQYRGPNSDGTTEDSISKKWPSTGPKTVWKAPTLDGFSSLAVGSGRLFTLVGRNIEGTYQEVCIGLDANTGKEIWAQPMTPVKFDGSGNSGVEDNKGGEGPRSTPTIDGDKVYVLGAKLLLKCFEAKTGKVVWTRDLIKENAGRNISWENAASPLIEGNLVFVAGGGEGQSLLGINKTTGQVVWKGESDKMTHATPVAATILGTRQIIFFTQSGLVSVVPDSGKVLWRHNFKYSVSTAASPVVGGDIVYCAAGYGVGASAARISKDGGQFRATELWRTTGNKPVANHWSTPVYKDGYLYGMFSFKEYGVGPMKCVELATGQVKWEKPNFGSGQVILAGGTVVALSDRGEVVLVEANPTAYTELARADVLDGKCWSTPAVSNGRLYARSTKEAVCLDISSKTAMAK
jgi:outer membrane protein assembly factor BamB